MSLPRNHTTGSYHDEHWLSPPWRVSEALSSGTYCASNATEVPHGRAEARHDLHHRHLTVLHVREEVLRGKRRQVHRCGRGERQGGTEAHGDDDRAVWCAGHPGGRARDGGLEPCRVREAAEGLASREVPRARSWRAARTSCTGQGMRRSSCPLDRCGAWPR